MSSGKEKQAEGTMDKAKGKAKEAWGAVTNDTSKRAEGQGDQMKGSAKKKVGEVQDDLEK
jgi:uncharacterized protein YjbJ (UPF0337 family)